jgi:hypothetical protein
MNEGSRDFLTAGQHNLNLQSWFLLITKCMCFLLINLASAEVHEIVDFFNQKFKTRNIHLLKKLKHYAHCRRLEDELDVDFANKDITL